jgi:hypothetical protein
MRRSLDHLLLAAADLDLACAWFERHTGVRPAYGGRHAGGATHNALVALGQRTYVELIAAMPGAAAEDELTRYCRASAEPSLFTYCLRAPAAGLETLAVRAQSLGLGGAPCAGARTTPLGVQLRWRLFEPTGEGLDRALPFFIDWLDSPHPAVGAPQGVRLMGFRVRHPQANKLNALLAQLGYACDAEPYERLELTAHLEGPRGELVLR